MPSRTKRGAGRGLRSCGKTYTWQASLEEVRQKGSCALIRYSYASLFGLNSLDALKLALFENLEFLDSPFESSLQKGIHYFKSLGSKAKKLNQLASAIPQLGQVFAKAGPLYFSLVRNQIVCIDDLERRGGGLDLKDVFGLISFLREQRSCKVMLLLNADALAGHRTEFDVYFEKVIDAQLVLKPTATEATGIALSRSIVGGMKSSGSIVSLPNLDSAVVLLKELGRSDEAESLIKFFVDNKPPEFWDSSLDPFHRNVVDQDVARVAALQKAEAEAAPFNFEEELVRAGKTFNNAIIAKLAEVPIDDYYELIKAKKGDEMRAVIFSGLEFRKISNASPEMIEVVRRMNEALKKIGTESKLNAARVRRFGVVVPEIDPKTGPPEVIVK